MATVPIRDILDNETGEPIFPRTHVKAVVGLADSNFFEEYVDGNGARSVKLRPDYVGLWAEGWISNGGIGAGGGGGGGGLINGVYGASSLGTIYSQGGTEDITKTFSAFAIDKIWQTVLGVQQSIPIVSLNNGASYSTLVINGTTADFYTKAQVDGLISGIHSFEPVPVQTLPTASADTMYKLYLVPSEDPQSQNIKDEYITYRTGSAGNYTYSWEKVGSTAIDLTGYATESWVNQQGFLKTETDPTVPAWAKSSTKPSYAFSEITNKPTTVSGYGITDAVKTSGDQSIGGNKTFTSTIFAHYIMEASESTPLVIGNPLNLAYIKIVEDTSIYDVALRGIQVVDDTPYIKWEIAENGAASFASLSVGGASVTPANYVTLSGAQTISGAKTFSGGITMSGANILPSIDNTVSIGTNDLRVNSAFIRDIYTSFLQFREGTTKTPIGQIAFGVGYSQLSILGNNAKDFMYYPDKFFASGGNADLGLSDHRWRKVWSVDADLSGGISVGGDIVPSADLGSQLGYSNRRFSNLNARTLALLEINFKNQENTAQTGYLTFKNGLMVLRSGVDINSSYKQINFYETYGLYPENGSSINLGYYSQIDNRFRWANIYGVNEDLSGNLVLASSSHIDIGPLRIEYDATNKALHITKKDGNDTNTYGLYADGFVAAGGVGQTS